MVVNQLYELFNNLQKQALGKVEITVTDTKSLVTFGEKLSSSEADDVKRFKDPIFKTLLDACGRLVLGNRLYDSKFAFMFKDGFTYGSFIKKRYVRLLDAIEDPAWSLETGKSVDNYVIYLPSVQESLLVNANAWEIPITIPDLQVNSSFTNAEEANAFVEAILVAVRNSITLKLEAEARGVTGTVIARKISNHLAGKPGIHAVNLMQEYYELTGDMSLSLATAPNEKEFLRTSINVIKNNVEFMQSFTSLYNEDENNEPKFTPKDELVLALNSRFALFCETALYSTTLSPEYLNIGKFEKVPFWQGVGTSGKFEDTTKISFMVDGKEITQSGIIGIAYDERALGATVTHQRVTTSYNSHGEYTNNFNKFLSGNFADFSENIVVFYIGEIETAGTAHSALDPDLDPDLDD